MMNKLIIAVALAATVLSGCANNRTASGDTFTASQARQVQTVTYGTVVSARPVTIQGGDKNNVAGAIGGAVVGGFWVILSAVAVVIARRPQAVSLLAVWRVRAYKVP